MKSIDLRTNKLFLRNDFPSDNKWGFALVKKQSLDLSNVELLACSDTKAKEEEKNRNKGVHFFVDDIRFKGVFEYPLRTLKKFKQYSFMLTPDYSLYADMPLWLQIGNVGKNRYVGAFWQKEGLLVIPTISWALKQSYEFCFEGVERGGIVAVGTIGSKHAKKSFLNGYDCMLEMIRPMAVLCYGTPFKEMRGNIISVDYIQSRRKIR